MVGGCVLPDRQHAGYEWEESQMVLKDLPCVMPGNNESSSVVMATGHTTNSYRWLDTCHADCALANMVHLMMV